MVRTPPPERQLTPRLICEILKIELPASLESIADTHLTYPSHGLESCHPGCVYFLNRTGKLANSGVRQVAARGAKMVVVKESLVDYPIPQLAHPDPLEAYIEVSRWLREQKQAKVIAVTGSCGKTTTKEMLRSVSQIAFSTYCSKGNLNGPTWVGRYASTIPSNAEVYIQETGIIGPGSVGISARILQPDAAIITNIGLIHAAHFSEGIESILAEKLTMVNEMGPSGVVVFNLDDPELQTASQSINKELVSFAINDTTADYRAINITNSKERLGSTFEVASTFFDEPLKIELDIVGEHNIYNALAVVAIAHWLGIDNATIAKGLGAFRTSGQRQNLIHFNSQTIYADCYNASPESVIAVIKTLQTLPTKNGGKRLLVLADIAELGEHSEKVHREIGDVIAKATEIDHVLLYGPQTKWVYDQIQSKPNNLQIEHFEDKGELISRCRDTTGTNDVIAFKGSRSMKLEEVITQLFGPEVLE